MKRLLSTLLMSVICVSLSACGQSDKEAKKLKEAQNQTLENIASAKEHDENYITIVLDIVNATNVDFGAEALIDPKTKEQILLEGTLKQNSLSVEIDWPKDEDELNWAIYTTDGQLYMEGVTKIEEDKHHITLTMEGDSTVENVTTECTE